MSRLLDVDEMRASVKRVTREAWLLYAAALAELDVIDGARSRGEPEVERFATQRLARIARQLTRAQAGLVATDDERYSAAQAVIGYCDEADAKDRPWNEPVPPVTLGAVA